MKTQSIDFEAARAELRGKQTAADAALAAGRERLGGLALDVTLGTARQTDLDAATAEQARLQAASDALSEALTEVDRREAAHRAEEAERECQAGLARFAELQATCDVAGEKIIDLAAKLGAALAEGRAAAQEAEAIGGHLGLQTLHVRFWATNAKRIVSAHTGEGGGFLRPGEREAAERELAGKA